MIQIRNITNKNKAEKKVILLQNMYNLNIQTTHLD